MEYGATSRTGIPAGHTFYNDFIIKGNPNDMVYLNYRFKYLCLIEISWKAVQYKPFCAVWLSDTFLDKPMSSFEIADLEKVEILPIPNV